MDLFEGFPKCSWVPVLRMGDGRCWLVNHRDRPGQRAWLKAAGEGGERGRWGLEVEILRRLNESAPDVAPELLDAGWDGEDPWLVTACVGRTVREIGRDALFSELEAADLIDQVGSDLAVLAADHGIVHRELKPANICQGEAGRFRLIDYGIASVDDERPLRISTWSVFTSEFQTETGHIVGTPRYMAPEQVADRGVSPRTDWWGLAAAALEVMGYTIPGTGAGVGLMTTLTRRVNPEWMVRPEGMPRDLWQSAFAPALAFDPARRSSPAVLAAALRRLGRKREAGAPSEEETPATRASQDGVPVAPPVYVTPSSFPSRLRAGLRGWGGLRGARRARCS